MKVKRPVVVKMVLTERLREKFLNDYQRMIDKYKLEIEQLQFQSKKMLQDAAKKGPEAYKLVYERLQKEEKSRMDKIKQYTDMISQLELLPDGSEMVHSQLESEVEVRVGDHWDKLMGKTEIIVHDGVIVEIRENGVEE